MRTLSFIFLCVVPWGCNLGDGVGLSDGSADADVHEGESSRGDADAGDAHSDAAMDAGTDAENLAEAGPITLVAVEANIVTDRVCDLDGDDLADNAIADLGEPHATLLAAALSMAISGTERGGGWVLHMPWVDDAGTPDDPLLTLTSFSAVDGSACIEETAAEGQYCAQFEYLDACGEPLSVSTDAEIVDGDLRATGWTVIFGTDKPLLLRRATIEGTVASGGAGAELTICGYAAASELGDSHAADEPDGLSELELYLAGGSAIGLPTVPGMTADVDADGDGLERFEVDSDFRVERCIDGDATVIEGDGCWRDERIADGFSLTLRASFISAVYLGRERGWDRRECGLVYGRLESCYDSLCFNRRRREICPRQRSVLDAVLECERARCLDECGDPPMRCRACAEAECGVELAACLEAPDCCPAPPETSLWDPA